MHSEDGRFWWDGSQWQPAYSADGFLWFDGTGWRPRNWSPEVSPRRRRPWRVVGIVAAVLVALGAVGVSIAGLYTYANADNIEFIDLPELIDAAAVGCAEVTRAISTAGPEDVAAGNAAIDALIARVEAVGDGAIDDDYPTRDWIVDWRLLEKARSDAVAAGGPLVVPRTEDDYPITKRMIDAAPVECERAVHLATTQP